MRPRSLCVLPCHWTAWVHCSEDTAGEMESTLLISCQSLIISLVGGRWSCSGWKGFIIFPSKEIILCFVCLSRTRSWQCDGELCLKIMLNSCCWTSSFLFNTAEEMNISCESAGWSSERMHLVRNNISALRVNSFKDTVLHYHSLRVRQQVSDVSIKFRCKRHCNTQRLDHLSII